MNTINSLLEINEIAGLGYILNYEPFEENIIYDQEF